MRKRRFCKYRSSFEDKILEMLRAESLQFEYETMKLKYTIDAVYTPDLILSNGIIVELKGYFDADDRRKMRLVKEQHPHLDIRLVFQKAEKTITKSSKTTYAQWAEKNGFKWANQEIPRSWFNEKTHV